jgi:hypothetical protein
MKSSSKDSVSHLLGEKTLCHVNKDKFENPVCEKFGCISPATRAYILIPNGALFYRCGNPEHDIVNDPGGFGDVKQISLEEAIIREVIGT